MDTALANAPKFVIQMKIKKDQLRNDFNHRAVYFKAALQ